ncbi:DUF1345 domain-containing protein [Streptomyces sp. NPDC102360]|uniref:DUF1345 domain-containing protein n=1 Tax=Streptomyces sp. NPDC102360 TaxID=3366160 RepID=UPI0038216DD3
MTPAAARRHRKDQWLSERRRSVTGAFIAAGTTAVLLVLDGGRVQTSGTDVCVLVMLAYLFPYLLVTSVAFSTASPERLRTWAVRESRGTTLQRYVYGTAPGPGVSIFIAAAALLVAVVWLPGHIGSGFGPAPRAAVALVLVAVAWICVAVSFAVAFQADNLMEEERALEFPGEEPAVWADHVYFALSVMTTFGTTDVNVTSREMRRTVMVNSVIAFVFNTVTVASMVSALD